MVNSKKEVEICLPKSAKVSHQKQPWRIIVLYIISQIILAIWLLLTYDLLEDTRTDESLQVML